MTDREMLEFAALAAGIQVTPHVNRSVIRDLHFISGGKNWNPLTDDGDALRLAVKLYFHINQFPWMKGEISAPGFIEIWQFDGDDPIHVEWLTKTDTDANAATRRAIVCAAAEIGRKMP